MDEEQINQDCTDDTLLLRFIHGETSSLESTVIAERIRMEDEFRSRYIQLRKFADAHIVDHFNQNLDIEAAINKLEKSLDNEKLNHSNAVKRKIKYRNIWIPATVILIILWSLKIISVPHPVKIKTSDNRINNYILPDGSVIWLNNNSMLIYPKRFNAKRREVSFSGEAFFKISPSKKWPFIIHTSNGIIIKVVGTEFNIKSYPYQKNVIVSVKKGLVMTSFEDKNLTIPVKQGETAKLDPQRKDYQISEKSVTNSDAWRTGIIDFNETSLGEVIKVLDNVYNVHIVLENHDLEHIRVTSRFQKESIDSVLKVIGFIYGLQVNKKNGIIYLSSIN